MLQKIPVSHEQLQFESSWNYKIIADEFEPSHPAYLTGMDKSPILIHRLVTWGVLSLTTKYSMYCHKQAANLIVRKHILPATVVNIDIFQLRREDLGLLTRLLTVTFSVHCLQIAL